jgi:hypothetical protein
LRQRLPVRRLPAHHRAGRRHEGQRRQCRLRARNRRAGRMIVERMSGRRSHPVRAASTTSSSIRQKWRDVDDVTGEAAGPARRRQGRNRQEAPAVYHNQTEVLLGYYNNWAQSGLPGAPKYRKISGVGPVEQYATRRSPRCRSKIHKRTAMSAFFFDRMTPSPSVAPWFDQVLQYAASGLPPERQSGLSMCGCDLINKN